MKVPAVLRAGDSWLDDSNTQKLRLMLAAHNIKIDDCYEIHFGKSSMEVYRFKTDSMGHKFTENGGVARQPAVRIRYRAGLAPEVEDGHTGTGR